jgi:hypothetical protein
MLVVALPLRPSSGSSSQTLLLLHQGTRTVRSMQGGFRLDLKTQQKYKFGGLTRPPVLHAQNSARR